ncbi:VIR protein [Plasmodium vivax]|uniref:VIR protein n=1 Tax=Plasmodium vivax TaxID=5855 RepID=A0A1G4E4M3_PLAVI|nr:VIR protein [Plasmodium vivax]
MEEYINNFSEFFHKYKPMFDRNHYENITTYDSECKEQFTKYPGTSISFSTNCIKCMKYLKYLDDYYPDTEDQKQGIIYLYFWLHYYELQNNINNVKTSDNIKKLMNSYGEIGQNTPNIHNVYNYYIENKLNYELNDLFYLYEKFDNFKNKPTLLSNRCTFAKECVEMYMNSIKKCNNNSNKYLCNELENFRNQYNEYKPTVTECQEVQSYLPSFNKYSTSVIILISFITISVLSSLLFILYKFTPFGSCFPFRRKRPQRIYSNLTNEEANLLCTRGRSRTPEAKPYNIAYTNI